MEMTLRCEIFPSYLDAAAGWPLEQDLQDRAWGLTDFRVVDPAGYYLRITSRAG